MFKVLAFQYGRNNDKEEDGYEVQVKCMPPLKAHVNLPNYDNAPTAFKFESTNTWVHDKCSEHYIDVTTNLQEVFGEYTIATKIVQYVVDKILKEHALNKDTSHTYKYEESAAACTVLVKERNDANFPDASLLDAPNEDGESASPRMRTFASIENLVARKREPNKVCTVTTYVVTPAMFLGRGEVKHLGNSNKSLAENSNKRELCSFRTEWEKQNAEELEQKRAKKVEVEKQKADNDDLFSRLEGCGITYKATGVVKKDDGGDTVLVQWTVGQTQYEQEVKRSQVTSAKYYDIGRDTNSAGLFTCLPHVSALTAHRDVVTEVPEDNATPVHTATETAQKTVQEMDQLKVGRFNNYPEWSNKTFDEVFSNAPKDIWLDVSKTQRLTKWFGQYSEYANARAQLKCAKRA